MILEVVHKTNIASPVRIEQITSILHESIGNEDPSSSARRFLVVEAMLANEWSTCKGMRCACIQGRLMIEAWLGADPAYHSVLATPQTFDSIIAFSSRHNLACLYPHSVSLARCGCPVPLVLPDLRVCRAHSLSCLFESFLFTHQ